MICKNWDEGKVEELKWAISATLRLHGRGKVNGELDGRNCGRVAWDGGEGGGGGQKAHVKVLGYTYKGWCMDR